MPFATNAELPNAVQDRHKGHCLDVYRQVFNETFDRHGDEARAFATAETAAKQCEASKMTEPMAVKFVDGSDTRIEGLAIPFGGPFAGKDFHGEDFGPDTDLVPALYPSGRPIIYHHGLNKGMEVEVQGRQLDHEAREEGIWAQGELDKAAKYHSTVSKLINDGKLFFSSGAIPHLVKTNADGHITRWPWNELSLTPSPANPDARVYAVKATDHIDHLLSAGIDIPDPVKSLIGVTGLESEPFAVHADRITDLLDSLANRAEIRHEARAKAGRTLSASNRTEIEEVVATIDAALTSLTDRRGRLAELLARSDPKAAEAAKAAETEFLRFLQEQARINGVPMGT